ncbi:MAG: integrase core domain-containing protein [Bdellovibrionota bacterium]
MPWNQTDPMNERVKFIAGYLEGEFTFSELCEDYGISRKTGYKWVERYQASGVTALEDLSRAPKSHPLSVPEELVREILQLRRKHPRWGPRKLLVLLKRRSSDLMHLPAASTVGEILKRNGLVQKKRRRVRRSSLYTDRLGGYESPNSIWCADFKGHFPVGGARCHPLTITDGFSRFLIRCQALPRPLSEPSRKIFEAAFREFGLPTAIRTDNGAPFSTLAPGGLSRLAIWWIRLGIRPERIMPGRPDQNGRHERMHRTLKAETARPPRNSFRSQQRAFDQFREEYNQIRPHEALHQAVPASIYQPSNKRFPEKLPEPEYPDHFRVERTYPNGVITIGKIQWYLSGCLKGELVGLEEVDNDRWKVYFGPVPLGILDLQNLLEKGARQFGYLIRTDGGHLAQSGRPRHQ